MRSSAGFTVERSPKCGSWVCLRSTTTSLWHSRCRRGPSTPTNPRKFRQAESGREYANLWGSLRGCCGCPFVVRGTDPGIARAEGALERVIQNGGAHVKEGLHRRSVPTHLLLFVHAHGHDLVDRTLYERGRDRFAASTPGGVVYQRTLVALEIAQ